MYMSDTGLQSRKFIYSNLGVYKIRLLHLLSGDWNDEIRCVVFETYLHHQTIEYEAVSYTWGDPARPKKSVRVTNSPNGKVPRTAGNMMEVSEGTFEALRRLRLGKEQVNDQHIINHNTWNGTVSRIRSIFVTLETLANVNSPPQINQDNVNERSAQVQMMKDIFSRARRVLAYVGEAADDSSVLLEAMQASQESLLATLVSENPSATAHGQYVDNPMRRCLETFLRRRWFSRIWVVQEVVLAKEIILICGDSHTSWEAFQAAVRAWHPQHTIAEPLPAVLRRTDWVSSGVLQALQTTRMCEATDGRDKVYGIGALLRVSQTMVKSKHISAGMVRTRKQRFASQAERIPPINYKKSVRSVFFGVADNQVNSPPTNTRLGVLSYVQSDTMTPSWVPDWRVRSGRSVIAFDAPGGGYSKTLYRAGGDFEDPMLLLRGSTEEKGRQYITVGIIVLGIVKEVARTSPARGPRMDRGIGLKSWDYMVWLHHNPNADLRKGIIRDEEHDLFSNWFSAIDIGPSFVNEAMGPRPGHRLFPDAADVSIDSQWPQWLDNHEPSSSMHESFRYNPDTSNFKRADSTSWDQKAYEDNLFLDELGIAPQDYGLRMTATRALMLLDDDTYALGPSEAKVDDIICVMIGASVPFVIRRRTERERSAVLVGECWVKSVMQGEAVRQKKDQGYDQSFIVSEEFERRGYRVKQLDLF
ncbi:hypothetical protein LTR56_015969 [Elasticomyces elasticus]|nr:hypothetical protein LTR22_021256 [Elasticomyces elasticus]KAK3633055.1 hypothetical protein LTR56_015969 [Elasticomyces elasticus]KAK4917953.1 hypothetical protein LTR49_014228 [Elasticomyces elasticus]KAK5753349.1 hypothetical protein LTS12_016592 [Elasticomyces elasticus]